MANKTVYELLIDGPGAGPCGDGTYVRRSIRKEDMLLLHERQVSPELFKRWRREGKV